VFRVVLPALSSGAVLAAVHVPPPLPVQPSRGRILVIDDEHLLRRAFARSLESEHDVVLAASGEQAREIVLRDPDFDVVLCDLMMPGMTGMDWYKWLSSHDRGLAARVIFVTGGAVTQKAREFLAHHDHAVVSKPFEPREILAAVARARATRTGVVSVRSA
jgi:CheY-like chemotaxis protein